MDPLTHGVLGAALSGLLHADRDDVRLPAAGAMAGALPDIDIIPTLFMGPLSQLDMHRGFTHSFFFALLAPPLLGFFLGKIFIKSKNPPDAKIWTFVIFLGIMSHIIMDCFTSYGTRIFLPFSDYRVAWGTIAVFDPMFTIPAAVSAVSLFLVNKSKRIRRIMFNAGILASLVYLSATAFNKVHVDTVFTRSLASQKIDYGRLMTTPMPLTNFLWVGIAEGREYYYTGYYSIFDRDHAIHFEKDKKNHEYIRNLRGNNQIEKLVAFAKDFYTIDSHQGGIVFNDLRYGSLAAGGNSGKEFMFSYIINDRDGKLEIIRKARTRITPVALSLLIKRISGKD